MATGSIKQVTTKLAIGIKQVGPCSCGMQWQLLDVTVQVPTKLAIGIKATVEKGEEGGKSWAPSHAAISMLKHKNIARSPWKYRTCECRSLWTREVFNPFIQLFELRYVGSAQMVHVPLHILNSSWA